MQGVVLGTGIQCTCVLPLHTSLVMQMHTCSGAHVLVHVEARPGSDWGQGNERRAETGASAQHPSKPPQIAHGSILAWREKACSPREKAAAEHSELWAQDPAGTVPLGLRWDRQEPDCQARLPLADLGAR